MSIVVSVKVFDGVVLGADSQTQIFTPSLPLVPGGPSGSSFAKAYGNARKLFQIQNLGVVTYGAGNLGKRSVEGVLHGFQKTLTDERLPVAEVATKLLEYVKQKYDEAFATVPPEARPVMGFLIAGYNALVTGDETCEEWEFLLPHSSHPALVRPADDFGASWRGMAGWFTRLFFGIDGRIIDEIGNIPAVPEAALTRLKAGMPMPIIFESMPLQDAVDFAEFVLDVTIGSSRFEVGVPACAPPLDIAVIKRDAGFKWIKRKPLEIQTERSS